MNTEKFFELVRGKKTYLAVIIGVLYVLGAEAGCWEFDGKVLGAVGLGALGFLRSGLKAALSANGSDGSSSADGARANGTNGQRAAVLALVCALSIGAAGCQTQNATGRVLVTTVQTVDAAMQGWAQWVAAGQASAGDEAKVSHAYGVYQAAELAAEKAYVAAAGAPDSAVWVQASAALKAAQVELIALVRELSGGEVPAAK